MKTVYITVATIPSTTAHAAYVANICSRIGATVIACSAGSPLDYSALQRLWNVDIQPGKIKVVKVLRRSAATRIYSMAINILTSSKNIFVDSIAITHNPLVAMALKIRRIPFIYDAHSKPGRGLILKFAFSGKSLKGCIYNSDLMKELYAPIIKHKHIPELVLGSGIDVSSFRKLPDRVESCKDIGLDPNKLIIGYIGSLGHDRGIGHLLQVAGKLKDLNIYWCFVGGKAEDVTHWQDYAKSLGLSDKNVFFAGHRPQNELPKWYAISSALCASYTSDVINIDAMAPMKLYEYCAVGKPILAPSFEAIAKIVGDRTCVYYEPDSVSALHEAVLKISNEYEALSDAAASDDKSLDNNSWDAKSKKMLCWIEGI